MPSKEITREEMRLIVHHSTYNGGGEQDRLMKKLNLLERELPRAYRLEKYRRRFGKTGNEKACSRDR